MGNHPLWIFAYGSLMWNPGFEAAETMLARLDGFRRGFFMWSVHHRGTMQTPGLVLALDACREASCEGLALRVRAGEEAGVLRELRRRELVTDAYMEQHLPVKLEDGRYVRAVSYVVDRRHRQYCPRMSEEQQALVIAKAVGGRGPNSEYLFNTLAHIHALGMADSSLERIAELVQRHIQARAAQ